MIHSARGRRFIFLFPVSENIQLPTQPTQSHPFLCRAEVEVNRGDVREVFEIGAGSWKVVLKRRFLTTKGEVQIERCPSGGAEVIQKDGMWRSCGDGGASEDVGIESSSTIV